MKPHVKLFVSSPAIKAVFGGGKWMLLNAIQEQGSLQKAARKLGRGYRKAWGDIRIAEEGFGQPLVTRLRGGAGGGRTELTWFGKKLLEGWDKYRSEVIAASEKSYAKHVSPVLKNR